MSVRPEKAAVRPPPGVSAAVAAAAAAGRSAAVACAAVVAAPCLTAAGHALLRGVSAEAIMSEMFGKATGCSGGRGGHQPRCCVC